MRLGELYVWHSNAIVSCKTSGITCKAQSFHHLGIICMTQLCNSFYNTSRIMCKAQSCHHLGIISMTQSCNSFLQR